MALSLQGGDVTNGTVGGSGAGLGRLKFHPCSSKLTWLTRIVVANGWSVLLSRAQHDELLCLCANWSCYCIELTSLVLQKEQ